MIRESLSSFFNNWQIDKDKSTEILSENRKYNSELKLGKILGKNYPEDKKTYSLYSLNSASIISKKLPALFHNKAGIPKFNNHIKVVIVIIVNSFTPAKLNNQTAIDPLIAQSNIFILGIIEASKYIVKIIDIAN